MNLVTKPTEEHISQLREWLLAEERETGEGFFCNWNIIYKAYTEDRLFVVESDSEAVALLVWSEYSPNAAIEILTVKPNQRGKGIGRFLADSFIEFIKRMSVTKVSIQCQPRSSEGFWMSLGFNENQNHLCERINGVPMQELYMYRNFNEC